MRVLITGATGFAGSHLAEYAIGQGAEVFASIRWRSRTDNIEGIRRWLTFVECDLRDSSSVMALIRTARPDVIFHLAAHSFVGSSWHAPAETFSNNVLTQVNLLEAVRTASIDPIIQVAGSSEEYGMVEDGELPIRETNPLRPVSPYAVSKVAQDLMGYQYHKSYGMKIVRTRAFNHTGPRRGQVFASSEFAKQIAEAEIGIRDPIFECSTGPFAATPLLVPSTIAP